MVGSTDGGNIDKKCFFCTYLDTNNHNGAVYARNNFLCVLQPKSTTSIGLTECISRALTYMGLEQPEKLISLGCDETSIKIGNVGLRGKLEVERPWLITTWCVVHRLELSIKYALKATLFHEIDDANLLYVT